MLSLTQREYGGHSYGRHSILNASLAGALQLARLPGPATGANSAKRSPSPAASQPHPAEHDGILLPTPTVADSRSSANTTAHRTQPTALHGGRTLTDAARLLPTPRSSDGTKGSPGQHGSHGDLTLPSAAAQALPVPDSPDTELPEDRRSGAAPQTTVPNQPGPGEDRWGNYTAAVARWELLSGRPAPNQPSPAPGARPYSHQHSSNGSWACPQAGSPTYRYPAPKHCEYSARESCHNRPPPRSSCCCVPAAGSPGPT